MAETNLITKELVEKVLNESILNFVVSPGSQEGDNVASVLTAIKAQSSHNNQTYYNLLHKAIPNTLARGDSDIARLFRFFETEHTFYNSADPLLQSIIQNKLHNNNTTTHSDYQLPIPKYYSNGLSSTDPDYSHIIWLQDLRPDGYKMMDKFIGLDLEQTKLILNELGKFHATTYFLLRNDGEQIFKTQLASFVRPEWLQPEVQEEYRRSFIGIWENVKKLLGKAGHKGWVEKLNRIDSTKVYDIMLERSTNTDKKYFPLIIHGDFWTNNILVKFDQDGHPQNVKFIDFQLTRRGNIYEELTYFIFTSTTPSFRAQHLTQVLQTYYDSFTNFLQALGCPKPINFSFGSLLDEFHKNLLSTYIYMTFAIPLQLSTFSAAGDGEESKSASEDKPEVTEENIDPTEIFRKQLYNMVANSPRALQRLEDITNEMIKLDIL